MAKKDITPSYGLIQQEQAQSQPTRTHLYKEIERILGLPVLVYFTSFDYDVIIDDDDAKIIEQVLLLQDTSKGLCLIISSPGGDGLSAENITNLCRTYSGTGEYTIIVPRKAKSAATMICFGANKIMMGPSAELGPIDPQVKTQDGVFSVCNYVDSYRDLFKRAVQLKSGRIEPYIQQLNRYDERRIKEFENSIELSRDIGIKALHSGMMKGKSAAKIRESIKIFLTPEHTKSHGRAIYASQAAKCGLNIEKIDRHGEIWAPIHELYMRVDNFVSSRASKCIETKDHSFVVGIPE